MPRLRRGEGRLDQNSQIEAFSSCIRRHPVLFLVGAIAGKIGAKYEHLIALGVYTGIQRHRLFMTTRSAVLRARVSPPPWWHGMQEAAGLSRSLFATGDPERSSRSTSDFRCSRSSRGLRSRVFGLSGERIRLQPLRVLSVIMFFVSGGRILTRVNVARGRSTGEGSFDRKVVIAGGKASSGRALRDRSRRWQ